MNHRDAPPEPSMVDPDDPAHAVDQSSTMAQNDHCSVQTAVPTAAMPLMSRLRCSLCEFARPLYHAGRQAAAVIGRGGPESGSDSNLGSVPAGQTNSDAPPDSIPCGTARHDGPSAAGAPTPVVHALAAGVEDGFDDEPAVLAGIARTFLSVAIVFAMTVGLWTASRSPVPRPSSNQSAVAGADAFSEPAALSSTSPSGRYRTKPIGEIRTGERVLAANPQVDHAVVTASEIDPATWRNIRLRMQKPHGGTLDIVLLRPLAWLAEQVDEFEYLPRADSHSSALDHAVGSRRNHAGVQLDSDVGHDTCWIHLALPELGAVGPAEVLATEPCPPVASGPGRTVTGTFAHAAADVLDLEIDGLDTPLGCTANHPFWSADRQDFVPAGALTIGEHLRTESGTLRQVTRITPRRGPPVAVFNLEVDAEHLYYVSTAGVLVHNAYPGGGPGSIAGSDDHKALRWKEYQEGGGCWSYSRWSNVYEQNMIRARIANRIVDDIHSRLGWGRREVTVNVHGVPRRLDVADVATRRAVEVKTGYVTLNAEIRSQLARDAALRIQGWSIWWHFVGTASQPLLRELDRLGIPYPRGK